jgi:hypothetical protein
MMDRHEYTPGPAYGAQVKKEGLQDKNKWMLILVRELRHSPEKSGRRSRIRRICANGRYL